jgi:hypothetical protein
MPFFFSIKHFDFFSSLKLQLHLVFNNRVFLEIDAHARAYVCVCMGVYVHFNRQCTV